MVDYGISRGGTVNGNLAVTGALTVTGAIIAPSGYIDLSSSPTFTQAAQTATPLVLALAANATYVLSAAAIISNATGITSVSWTGPAGATLQWNDTTTSTDYAATIGATNSYAASASTRMALFTGVLKTGSTAGNLTLTLGVSAGTTTLAAGSFLRLARVA